MLSVCFFQAEDGIRDRLVTGVQTCALPIFQSFSVIGSEIVEIDSKKLQTIKIECPELHLTLNLSEKYDYLPVLIKKSNGKSRYYLTLTSYKKIH